MESSHMNNTGIATFANDCVFTTPNPAQAKNPQVRNSINGFPCLLYINDELEGVYTFNLDRYSTNSLGYDTTQFPKCLSYEISANSDTTAGAFVPWTTATGKTEIEYLSADFRCRYPDNRVNGDDDFAELKRLVDWVGNATDDMFREQIDQYFNLEYLIRYYLTVQLFGLVDNLGKNTMLTSFDGNIWYMQLYDCDSCTGLDNSGAMKFDSDIEVVEGVFNTSNSRLWEKLRRNFPTQILAQWEYLRLNEFTEENIMKYLVDNISDKIPEVNYNKDAWKKYIQLGTSYLFACHGNRRQQIQRWIRERLIYVDTLLEYTVSTNDYLTVRVNKLGEVHFDIQTFQPMYFSIKFRNETGGTIRHRIGRGETVRFSYNIPVATDQEILVYGGRFVKDLGDLSEMNPTNLLLDRATRLTKIKCNNSPALINASISSCTMLQEVDLRNCSNLGGGSDASLQTLDLTQCRNLRFVDIFGTQLTALHTSKVGGIIQEIIYPYSVQVVDIANQSRLQSVGIPCYYTGDYQDENNIFAENLSEVTLSNCPNIVSFVKNYCVDENGNEIPVPTFVGVSKGQMFNLSNTMTYLTQIDLSYCSNIISLTLDNFDKLVEINFDDISVWNATSSNLENLTLTNCPNVETLTFNQNTIDGNNSLGVAFKEGTILDLSGLYNLKHIRSNVGVKGLKKLILPLTIQSLVFDYPKDTTYSLGDSDIESIFSKDAVHDNDGFSGIDLLNIQTITDFSMGSLTKMNNAINLDIKITNTFPYFNYFKTSDYFKPEGTVDITEYRDDLDYLFKGVDLNKLTIICDEPLPHTSASYMFAFATCQDTEVINDLFDLMPNVTDFSYMFYNAYLKEAPYIPLRAENVSYMFYNNIVMESTPSNWLQSYIFVPNSAYCYTGCANIKWIDGIEGSIDVIPSEWGGYERINTTMTGENLVIEKTLEREIERFVASGQSFHNVTPLVGQTPIITANKSSQNIGQGLSSDILLNDGETPYGELEGFTLVNLASEKRSGELTTKKEKDRVSNVLPTTFKLDESKEMPVVRLEGSTLHNVANQDSKTSLQTNGNYGTFEIDENIDETTHIKDGKMYSTTLYGQTISNDITKPIIKHELNGYEPNKLITQRNNKEVIYEYGNFENATLKGKTLVNVVTEDSKDDDYISFNEDINGQYITIEDSKYGSIKNATIQGETLVNIVQEPSETEYVITGDAFEEQSGTLENTVEGNIKSAILLGRTEVNDGVMQSVNIYPNQTVKKITWSSGRYYTEQGALTSVNATANHKYFEDYFDVLPDHTLRVKGNNTMKYLNFYDESKTFISRATLTSTDDLVATVPSNARYYRYSMLVNSGMTDETVIYDEDMQINIADTSIEADYLQKMCILQTSNEDGSKTNILSVNEELHLRKVDDVYDELDLLTGKLIQRISEDNEILEQEVVKTVSTTILDQDNKPADNLHTFDTTTHINTYAQGGGLIPFVNIPENISYNTGSVLKTNTTYTLQINRKESDYPFVAIVGDKEIEIQGNKAVLTTSSTINDTDIKFYGKNNIISKVQLFEGDYSNIEVPYFEGMQSTKMPVLMTIGRNVLNPKRFVSTINASSNDGVVININKQIDDLNFRSLYDELSLPVDTYTITCEVVNGTYLGGNLCIYDENNKNIRELAFKNGSGSITITSSINKLRLWNAYGTDNCQIRVTITKDGSTEYEPYKSNILTVNEDVTLRSNGDVYDELNLLTGRLTQRIDENNEVLAQAVVKTVDLNIIDQDGKDIDNIHTFNNVTHINTDSDGLIPIVNINKEVSYESILKPSTNYTLSFNQVNIGDEDLIINVGGTEVIHDGNENMTITTPSELLNNTISFYGKNHIVNNLVMVEGEEKINVHGYFTGMASYKKESNKKSILTISNYPLEESKLHDDYKMNILESDEEIELRSNGDVCDELNLLTGELTQRIDENGEILAQEIIKTISLKGKPSINWQGDTYLHLENNTLYPQLDCEIESINYYEIPKLKANTLYTLRYVGEPTQCIFGGLTYKTENNMILTSGSSDNLLFFDKEVRKVVLIEGDVRDRNFDYFEGIESLGAVEIVTHKSDMSIFSKVQLPPHIQLHRLPDGTCDELDIKTGILTKRIDENYNLLEEEVTEKLILNYNNSCNYGVILPRGTSDNYNVITNEYKQNIDFIPIDGSIAFDTATIKDTTVKFSVALSKFEVDTTNVRGSDGIYCDNDLFRYEVSDSDYEHAYIENDTTLHIYVNKNRLSSYDQVGFQMYLTNNPFDLYYAMRNTIISYVNYEDLNPEKASWEMLDCTEDGSITIESGNMDKTLLLDCLDYVAPTKNRFEIDLLKANTQYTVYAEGISGTVQLNFGGNIVNFTSGNIYTSGETQSVEFYTDNEIKNLIIIEGDTRNETIEFFEGLTSSENITVISSNSDENESNKISYEGITLRSLPNGVKDEINVLTGEYIQRVGEVVLTVENNWKQNKNKDFPCIDNNTHYQFMCDLQLNQKNPWSEATCMSADILPCKTDALHWNGIGKYGIGGTSDIYVITWEKELSPFNDIKTFNEWIIQNPITVQYELLEPIIHQLDAQSLTPYRDGYISMEAEVNYPSFIYSLPSTNTFYIPKIKNMTQYTLKYPVGSGTVTIGNIQYNVTSDSMLFTTPIEITGDKNSLVFETDDNPTDIMILEGNYSNREVKYFTGINSVINPVIRVTNSLTGGSVEYKGNSDIALYSLPNKMSDKLDVLTGYLMRVTGIREYQDGDYELDNVFTDGINTVYKLDSPLLYRNINFPTPILNGYGTIELDSDEAIPQFNYRTLSSNHYPIELLEPNTTYTMIGEAQANTTFTLGGTYVGNYSGGKVVINLGSVTENSLKFSNDIGLKNFMLVKGDATNSTLPFYAGIKSVEDISFLIKGYDGQENNLVLNDSVVLRECGGVYDSIDLVNYTMTKRLNEIVLVGTEYWSVETSKSVDSNYQLFSLAVTSAKDTRNAKIYCDKLIHKYLGNDTDCVYFENNKLYLCINKHTIGGDNINALKVWLTKNNVKIIYPLINDVKLDLDVVWEITPPITYETQTEFDTTVTLNSLKPMLAVTVATTTLEEIVSTLEAQNAKLEEENIATMLALTGIYETMVVPTIDSGISTVNLSDGKDGNNMNGMSISPMGMIYAKLVKKGFKTIEQVPAHLQAEVKYVLKEDK